MVGAYVITEADVYTRPAKLDSIGMGTYNMDCHNTQRALTPNGPVLEGALWALVQPYEIPYRALTPKADECTNLLVTVCVSASHLAYSSIRMEPVYMIVGHGAGVAAAHAARDGVAVQAVDIGRLQERLREQGQIVTFEDAPPPAIDIRSLAGIVMDDGDAILDGLWWDWSTAIKPFVGRHYLHWDPAYEKEGSARFVPDLPTAGRFEVRVSYPAFLNRASNVSVTVNTVRGPEVVTLNQREKHGGSLFTSLGVYELPAGPGGYVEFTTAGADGFVVLDAVQWLRVEPETTAGPCDVVEGGSSAGLLAGQR